MPIRGCKSSYEVMTMGLIFAAVVILVTTTTEAREIRCFPYSMMGENSVGPNAAAALSPSSVLCLFPNADMFAGAMGGNGGQRQQHRRAAEEAEDEQPLQRPPEEVLRNLRPQKLYRRSPSNVQVAFPQGSRLLPRLY